MLCPNSVLGCRRVSWELDISSAYHPQSQGALERFNQTLKAGRQWLCVFSKKGIRCRLYIQNKSKVAYSCSPLQAEVRYVDGLWSHHCVRVLTVMWHGHLYHANVNCLVKPQLTWMMNPNKLCSSPCLKIISSLWHNSFFMQNVCLTKRSTTFP